MGQEERIDKQHTLRLDACHIRAEERDTEGKPICHITMSFSLLKTPEGTSSAIVIEKGNITSIIIWTGKSPNNLVTRTNAIGT